LPVGNVVALRPDIPVQMHVHPALPRTGGTAMPFADDLAIARHLEHLRLRGRAPGTIYQRRRALARLAAALPVPLLDATAGMLTEWRAGLTVGDLAVAHYVSHAREFYAWGLAAGLVDANPVDGLPVPPVGRRLPRPIGEESLFAAITSASDRIRPWLVLAAWAGLRAKEIACLCRHNVLDTARPPGLLIVREATKGRTERFVPLSAFVLGELLPCLPASGWVFRRRDGRPGPNRPWRISKLANDHLHGCGIPETLHQLRHRFATQAYAVGHDLRVVQELLGHQYAESSAGYAAINCADAVAAVEAIPAPRHLRAVGQ
jgi:integrase/recombinase XerC